MSRFKLLTVALSVAFLFTLTPSVKADPVDIPPGLEKFKLFEVQSFDFSDISKADIRGLLSEHFANNNGNHFGFRNSIGRPVDIAENSGSQFALNNNGRRQGFSVAAVRPGMGFGLSNPRNPHSSVTPNPEPTGMLLLGTGLAAGAAFLRRKTRKRRNVNEG